MVGCDAAIDTHERDYCEWESLNATCSRGHVIVIREARYGRMRVGRCVGQSYGHIGCGSDVTDTLHAVCSGRQHCHVPVISLYSRRSCPKDFTSYLHAAYDCQPGDNSPTNLALAASSPAAKAGAKSFFLSVCLSVCLFVAWSACSAAGPRPPRVSLTHASSWKVNKTSTPWFMLAAGAYSWRHSCLTMPRIVYAVSTKKTKPEFFFVIILFIGLMKFYTNLEELFSSLSLLRTQLQWHFQWNLCTTLTWEWDVLF